MTPEARRQAFREHAARLTRIDVPVYDTFGRDPLEPIVGGGPAHARICLFGRDPGRTEVELGMPFVGAGGQKIRTGLHQHLFGGPPVDAQAAIEVGRFGFWANTVPYKPVGNKVWSVADRRRFAPLVADLLLHDWQGTDVLAFGRVAYDWFGRDAVSKAALADHWARDDRFEAGVTVTLRGDDGASRVLTVHPVPHPSPLNATWAPHFARLLAGRLAAIGITAEHWTV
ncbi:MAG: uracil-DNA glycosylase family protein [Alphaproteobacteria bacterium]|nr:uracil-DNA glycosylase family protein [Alphaproteobacteria bacterium]